ncbi:hypothetical protein MMC17_004874 [Xylographa soralifera]|nr:hypothetical protein [Xylographa soralifera]
MAPVLNQALLSPAELAFLHSNLSLTPPIRPDLRQSSQFRPLIAETDFLPGTNGSARICFADGTEAIVGVKAEVEKSASRRNDTKNSESNDISKGIRDEIMRGTDEEEPNSRSSTGRTVDNSWVEMTIEIPGFRDDDSLPIFLAQILNEALLATGELVAKLWINRLWHWKLYIDILLLSPPLSYPLPLLSLTTHLALLSTRLPTLKSELDEDPLFNDDWDAAISLYPHSASENQTSGLRSHKVRPPITLLVMAVGSNIIFDPTREELAVADAVLAISLASLPSTSGKSVIDDNHSNRLRLLSIRTIDPPSRLTTAGVPDAVNTATGGTASIAQANSGADVGLGKDRVWHPPQGGMKRGLIGKILQMCLERGGVGEEVLAGLDNVDTQLKHTSILILGAGWTSTFLIPLLEARQISHAATSTTGRPGTLPFKFDPSSPSLEPYHLLPSASTILITFPLKGPHQSTHLLSLYRASHPAAAPNWIQLGSTGIFQIADQEQWVTRHSKYDRGNARAVAEDELLALGGCVLNLSGLWGGARQPRDFVKRVAASKEQLKGKTSLHMVHGMDVARAVVAVHESFTKGERWMLTDMFVYDWWALILGWGDGGSEGKDEDAEGPLLEWVRELMVEEDVRALPRSMELLGRCYDSREFWSTFGIAPVRARL